MPISAEHFAAFVLASVILLVIPGPTIIMVITQALAHGRRVALASVVGVGLGDLLATSLSIAERGRVAGGICLTVSGAEVHWCRLPDLDRLQDVAYARDVAGHVRCRTG